MDWLTATFACGPFVDTETGEIFDPDHLARQVWSELAAWVGPGVVGQETHGRYGYAHGVAFSFVLHGSLVPIGRLDWGGERMGNRARLDISGAGCSRIKAWRDVRTWCEQQTALVVTRIDLAVDLLQGEFTPTDALDAYHAGAFRAEGQGMQPRHSMPGDWENPAYLAGVGRRWGRTLEIGRRENGKMCRVYEKGRQLGDSDSDWTRVEVEWRNNDRVLPLAMLTDCDAFFAGAYEVCAQLLPVAAERVPTHQAEGEIALQRAIELTRAAYGQVVGVLKRKLSGDEIVALLAREGLPRRLQRSALAAFEHSGADALKDREVIR